MFIGIIIVFVLPDFPHTWRLLSPELKMVAIRRMAIDAAEADLDEAGGRSHVRGMTLALTDPKVSLMLMFKVCTAPLTLSMADLSYRFHVPLPRWRDWLSIFLSNAHGDSWIQRRHLVATRGSNLCSYCVLLLRARPYIRQTSETLLVLDVSDSDRCRRLLYIYVHKRLRCAIL